MIYQQRF